MFYSTEILALKNKTSLALLFYISTTSNRTKKINKRDIESMHIPTAVSILQHPPQPFALRLYSILMKGLVHVYALKIKYYESEISVFYRTMMFKFKRKTSRKIGVLREKMGRNVLRFESGFMERIDFIGKNDFMERVDFMGKNDNTKMGVLGGEYVVESLVVGDTLSNGCDFFTEMGSNVEHLPEHIADINERKTVKRINIKRKHDRFIELMVLENEDLSSKTKKIKIEIQPVKKGSFDCLPVFEMLNVLIGRDKLERMKIDSTIELQRNETSLSFNPLMSLISLSSIRQETFECPENDYKEESSNEIDFSLVENNKQVSFNDKIESWSKKEKGKSFLKLLEYLTAGKMMASQIVPYGEITMSKSS